MNFKVDKITKKKIAENTWEFVLTVDDESFFFNAGQYVWVITPTVRRAFSIASSSADQKHIKIILRKGDSEFKKYILESKYVELMVSGSRGLLRVPDASTKTVYVVGGVAIAPFLSVASSLRDKNIDREIFLYFINESNENVFYIDYLDNLKKSYARFDYLSIVAKDAVSTLKIKDKEALYVVMGNQMFVDAAHKVLHDQGVLDSKITFEENYPSVVAPPLDKEEGTLFKQAIDQSISHTVVTDSNGTVIYANRAAETTTGFSFAEMQGETPRLWGGLMDSAFYKDLWKTIKVDKKSFSGVLKNIRKDGEVYYAKAMISPILDAKGNLLGFIGSETDISFEKKKEAEAERLSKLSIGSEIKISELKGKIAKLEASLADDPNP